MKFPKQTVVDNFVGHFRMLIPVVPLYDKRCWDSPFMGRSTVHYDYIHVSIIIMQIFRTA